MRRLGLVLLVLLQLDGAASMVPPDRKPMVQKPGPQTPTDPNPTTAEWQDGVAWQNASFEDMDMEDMKRMHYRCSCINPGTPQEVLIGLRLFKNAYILY